MTYTSGDKSNLWHSCIDGLEGQNMLYFRIKESGKGPLINIIYTNMTHTDTTDERDGYLLAYVDFSRLRVPGEGGREGGL